MPKGEHQSAASNEQTSNENSNAQTEGFLRVGSQDFVEKEDSSLFFSEVSSDDDDQSDFFVEENYESYISSDEDDNDNSRKSKKDTLLIHKGRPLIFLKPNPDDELPNGLCKDRNVLIVWGAYNTDSEQIEKLNETERKSVKSQLSTKFSKKSLLSKSTKNTPLSTENVGSYLVVKNAFSNPIEDELLPTIVEENQLYIKKTIKMDDALHNALKNIKDEKATLLKGIQRPRRPRGISKTNTHKKNWATYCEQLLVFQEWVDENNLNNLSEKSLQSNQEQMKIVGFLNEDNDIECLDDRAVESLRKKFNGFSPVKSADKKIPEENLPIFLYPGRNQNTGIPQGNIQIKNFSKFIAFYGQQLYSIQQKNRSGDLLCDETQQYFCVNEGQFFYSLVVPEQGRLQRKRKANNSNINTSKENKKKSSDIQGATKPRDKRKRINENNNSTIEDEGKIVIASGFDAVRKHKKQKKQKKSKKQKKKRERLPSIEKLLDPKNAPTLFKEATTTVTTEVNLAKTVPPTNKKLPLYNTQFNAFSPNYQGIKLFGNIPILGDSAQQTPVSRSLDDTQDSRITDMPENAQPLCSTSKPLGK